MPNIQVNSNGIKKLLKGLNIHKATGPDAIPARSPPYKPMLLVCQYVPTLEMVHYLAVKDMFQYFTRYGRE
jgi:hypothetical protein